MLLIDGVRYQEWRPLGDNAEDELEQMVKEHSQEIFGKNSVYLDKKQKLKSLAGVGSIPDGLVIMFGNTPEWHIVEVELSSHDPYGHIVPQVDRFLNGIENRNTRNKIIEVLYDAIYADEFLKLKTRQAIGLDKDIHKFLSDLIERAPTLTIIIEEYTSKLREAIKKYAQTKVVEFQTYIREDAGLAVHAHLFDPLYGREGKEPEVTTHRERQYKKDTDGIKKQRIRGTVQDLIDNQMLKVGQLIYKDYKGRRYEAKILHDGRILVLYDNSEHNSLSTAAKGIAGSVDGWEWWYTRVENGRECRLYELRKDYNNKLSS